MEDFSQNFNPSKGPVPDPEEHHPKNKPAKPGDPMMLRAQEVEGDPWVMLDCLIEEYARMGWDANRIEKIFSQPFFQASYNLTKKLGTPAIRSRIEGVLQRVGIFKYEITHNDSKTNQAREHISTSKLNAERIQGNKINNSADQNREGF